jgi:hypothetical protein
MGTQQILMIILSVIVVGAAIAVGIQMFDTQADNQTRQALVVEVMNMAVQAQAWYRTPSMMGGGGEFTDAVVSATQVNFIARSINNQAEAGVITNSVGTFTIAAGESNLEIIITGEAHGMRGITVEGSVFLNARGTGQHTNGILIDPFPGD